MSDWVMTAVTIACDAVDDEVTLMVNRDGATRCTGYAVYGQPDKDASRRLREKGRRLGRPLACEGPECPRVRQYREGQLPGEGRP